MDKVRLTGRGGVVNLKKATLYNDFFRREVWTGEHLQITLMTIPVGGEVGKEIHSATDQLLVVEQGSAAVFMGAQESDLEYVGNAEAGDGILVPAGTYHNVYNDGRIPLKLFSVYAPPHHPIGTLQRSKEDADQAEYEKE